MYRDKGGRGEGGVEMREEDTQVKYLGRRIGCGSWTVSDCWHLGSLQATWKVEVFCGMDTESK